METKLYSEREIHRLYGVSDYPISPARESKSTAGSNRGFCLRIGDDPFLLWHGIGGGHDGGRGCIVAQRAVPRYTVDWRCPVFRTERPMGFF